MTKTLNLIYSKRDAGFFNNLDKVQKTVLSFKKDKLSSNLTSDDEYEAGRGASYAVFPELKKLTTDKEKITIDTIRHSLQSRGVVDETFQNKILFFLLQTRGGIQFPLGSSMSNLFDWELILSQQSTVLDYEVQDKDHIKIIFKADLDDISSGEKVPGMSASIQLILSPEKLIIDKFEIKQVGETLTVKKWIDKLENNQFNFLKRFILFIKNCLVGTPELELENVRKDNIQWKSAFSQVSKSNQSEAEVNPNDDNSPKI